VSRHAPAPAVVREVYDDVAPKYAGLYDGLGPLPHFYQTRLRLVVDLLRPLPRGLVLDIGSGPGIVGDHVRRLGFRCVAADASVGMARECYERTRGDVGRYVSAANATALPFGDGVFDVVMALGVLEYVDRPGRALSEFRRVVRPGGTLLVSLLNGTSPYRRLRDVRRRLGLDRDPIPPMLFTRTEAERHLRAAGFGVKQVTYFDMEMLPPGFADNHPRLAGRVATAWERTSSSVLLRWLASAFLINAAAL